MGFLVDGYKIIERKHLDHQGRELLLIEDIRTTLLMVVLGDANCADGEYLGGHNRPELGDTLVKNLYQRINTVAEFHHFSSSTRDEIQVIFENIG